MYLALSDYIKSMEQLNASGSKDAKVRELLEYYRKYNCAITPGPGVFYGVIYACFSSLGQREESIEGQVREGLEYAARNNIVVLGVYMDRALTGRESEHRDSFQQMIKDAARGKWQYVITWKVDRFARNRYDAAIYKARLKKYNVRVVYAREQIPEGPEGILLESVLEGQAEYYSASLSQNVKRGQMDNAMECKSNGSLPLGYRTNSNKQIEIDPDAAPVIRLIFEMYNKDHTYKEIEDYLNDRGYKTKTGGAYNKNSFYRILRNDRYIGVYRYKDIVKEGGMPVIVEREMYEAVQRKLDKNQAARSRKKSDVNFLLTTKLYCGLCGKGMSGDSGTGRHGGKFYYYTCIGRKRDKTCDKKSVQKDWIEDLVINTTVELIHRDDVVQEIADGLMAYQKKEADQSPLHSLQVQLKDTDQAIRNLIKAIESGIITASTKSRLEELEEEKTKLLNSIAEESAVKYTVSREDILFSIAQFRHGDADDSAYRQTLIDVFVNAVYVFEDKIVITYNYSGKNNKVTLRDIKEALSEHADAEGVGMGSDALPSAVP